MQRTVVGVAHVPLPEATPRPSLFVVDVEALSSKSETEERHFPI